MNSKSLILSVLPLTLMLAPLTSHAQEMTVEFPDVQQLTENAQDSSITIDELFQSIEAAHQDFQAVSTLTKCDIILNQDGGEITSHLDHTGHVMYDDSKDVLAMYSLTESSADNEDNFGEAIVTTDDPNNFHFRNGKEEDFQTQELVDGTYATINPDYVKLLEAMISVKDDLKVSENEDQYLLTMANPEGPFLEAFQEQYSIDFTVPEGAELVQDAVIAINKDTHFIDSISLDFTYQMDGQDLIAMHIQTVANQWNDVTDEQINSHLP